MYMYIDVQFVHAGIIPGIILESVTDWIKLPF